MKRGPNAFRSSVFIFIQFFYEYICKDIKIRNLTYSTSIFSQSSILTYLHYLQTYVVRSRQIHIHQNAVHFSGFAVQTGEGYAFDTHLNCCAVLCLIIFPQISGFSVVILEYQSTMIRQIFKIGVTYILDMLYCIDYS